MQNPNVNLGGFNNMNGPHQSWNQGPRMQPFPAGAAPFYPQGQFQQTPWGPSNFGQNQQRQNTGPWAGPFMSGSIQDEINRIEEAKKAFKENTFNFDSIPDNETLQKEVRKAKLASLETQIHSLIFSYTLGVTATVNPPQILSLNGYRVEGAGEKLKHFDKETKAEIINSLMNFYGTTKVNVENLSDIRDALKDVAEQLNVTIESQTNMLNSLTAEIEIIKKDDDDNSGELIKKEALASLEELAASLRDVGLSDEEVEAKLQSIQKAFK